MKAASVDFWVWLIIVAFVVLGKAWSKLQEQIDHDSEKTAPKPRPGRPPRPQRTRPVPARPQPVGSKPPVAKEWRVGGEEVRKFFEELQRGMQPEPAPLPPMAQPKPPPVAMPTSAAPSAPPVHPPKPAPVVETKPARSAQWSVALRDRQNLRNIIISAEIIGRPKALEI